MHNLSGYGGVGTNPSKCAWIGFPEVVAYVLEEGLIV